MPVSHYNLWLAYLKKEQDQYKRNQSLEEAKNYIASLVEAGVEILKVEYFDRDERVANIRKGLV